MNSDSKDFRYNLDELLALTKQAAKFDSAATVRLRGIPLILTPNVRLSQVLNLLRPLGVTANVEVLDEVLAVIVLTIPNQKEL